MNSLSISFLISNVASLRIIALYTSKNAIELRAILTVKGLSLAVQLLDR